MELEQAEQQEETKQVAETPKPQSAPSYIEVNEKGLVTAKNNAELLRYCNAIVASGVVPKWFDTPQKLFGGLMFLRSLGLPDAAIKSVAVIHGVPNLFGDAPLALCQKSNELTYFCEKWFDRDYNFICFENKNLHADVFGAVCFIARNNGEKQSFSYTMDDAIAAGQYPAKFKDGSINNKAPWMAYPKIMLRYKARTLGLKSLFADKLNSVDVLEYTHDTAEPETIKDVSPQQELASELNKLDAP